MSFAFLLPKGAQPFIVGHMSEVTKILEALGRGEALAAAQLLPLVYDELRRLAAQKLAQEKPGQTLDATALVHEAYLRLVGKNVDQPWDGRSHFFAAAAEAMRRILVDNARRKRSQRRGGSRQRYGLLESDLVASPASDTLLDLDEALTRLKALDPQAAELAKLRLFAGMTIDEVAQAQGVSPRTAKRTWAYARAWLGRALEEHLERGP